MSTVELKVPDIGDFDSVSVIEIMVKVGDAIELEQSLITVESDKASMEIPSNVKGVITELKVKLGDHVKEGSVLALVSLAASDAAPTPAIAPSAPELKPAAAVTSEAPAPALASVQAAPSPAPVSQAAATSAVTPAHEPTQTLATLTQVPHASPSIRKLARELGVPLGEVKGSGPKGRISLEDIQAFSRRVMSGETQTLAQAASSSSRPQGAAGSGEALGLLP